MSKTYTENPVGFAILATGALFTLVALAFYFSGFISQNLSGEAYYDFQYAYRNSFSGGFREFFFERVRSRFMHGVLISALYQLFGYNPPAFYLVSLFLIIGAAVFVVLTLGPFIKSPWMAALLVAAFTWLPLNIVDLLALKKIHHAFAWFAFWLVVLLWQKWIEKRHIGWLFGVTLAFLGSVLAYEVAIALLPVAVFLSIPKLNRRQFLQNLGMALWITLLSGLAFLNLEGIKRYSVEAVYADSGWDISQLWRDVLTFLPRLPRAIWNSGFVESQKEIILFAQIIIGFIFVSVIYLLWDAYQSTRRENMTPFLSNPNVALILAAIWLAIGGYLPFILAGQAPESDGIRGAAFGMLLLLLVVASYLSDRAKLWIAISFLAVVCVFWTAAGMFAYSKGVIEAHKDDLRLQNIAITLKQQIPDISEGSTFVLVNSGIAGRTGCIGFMNMLFDRSNLHCIHLLEGDTQETYERVDGGLLEDRGRLFPERFVILAIDSEGMVRILDRLEPNDFPAIPVNWASVEPVQSNYSLISPISAGPGRNFSFFSYVANQSE